MIITKRYALWMIWFVVFNAHCTSSSSSSSSSSSTIVQGDAISGVERAQLLSKCIANKQVGQTYHITDVVFSPYHKFLFLNNVKAGSSSIRDLLNKVLGVNWFTKTVIAAKTAYNQSTQILSMPKGCDIRTKSNCFFSRDLTVNNIFVYSISRDPISKFESGVRQVWSRHSELKQKDADELLQMQLDLYNSWKQQQQHQSQQQNHFVHSENKGKSFQFFDEHFEPSTWQMTGWYGDDKIPSIDFIGSLENIDHDWNIIVKNFAGIEREEIYQQLLSVKRGNIRSELSSYGKTSLLSASSILKLCKSELYRHEWECLGYPLPSVCR
jgi:hypothetical protein